MSYSNSFSNTTEKGVINMTTNNCKTTTGGNLMCQASRSTSPVQGDFMLDNLTRYIDNTASDGHCMFWLIEATPSREAELRYVFNAPSRRQFGGNNMPIEVGNEKAAQKLLLELFATDFNYRERQYSVINEILRRLPYLRELANFTDKFNVSSVLVNMYKAVQTILVEFKTKEREGNCDVVKKCGCRIYISPSQYKHHVCEQHSALMLDVMSNMQYLHDKSGLFISKFKDHHAELCSTKITENTLFTSIKELEVAVALYKGMQPKAVLKKLGINVGLFKLTNKECLGFLEYVTKTNQTIRQDLNSLVRNYLLYTHGINGPRVNGVLSHLKNRTSINWFVKKYAALTKERSRDHYGETHWYTYVSRMDEFRRKFLVNGEKTSLDVVLNLMQTASQKRLEKKYKNDVFPAAPIAESEHIKYIDTAAKLVEEGDTMKHCVGSYISNCIRGKSFIYHVAYKGKHSTLELVPMGDGTYELSQHYGIADCTPDKELRSLVKDWCKTHNIYMYDRCL